MQTTTILPWEHRGDSQRLDWNSHSAMEEVNGTDFWEVRSMFKVYILGIPSGKLT